MSACMRACMANRDHHLHGLKLHVLTKLGQPAGISTSSHGDLSATAGLTYKRAPLMTHKLMWAHLQKEPSPSSALRSFNEVVRLHHNISADGGHGRKAVGELHGHEAMKPENGEGGEKALCNKVDDFAMPMKEVQQTLSCDNFVAAAPLVDSGDGRMVAVKAQDKEALKENGKISAGEETVLVLDEETLRNKMEAFARKNIFIQKPSQRRRRQMSQFRFQLTAGEAMEDLLAMSGGASTCRQKRKAMENRSSSECQNMWYVRIGIHLPCCSCWKKLRKKSSAYEQRVDQRKCRAERKKTKKTTKKRRCLLRGRLI